MSIRNFKEINYINSEKFNLELGYLGQSVVLFGKKVSLSIPVNQCQSLNGNRDGWTDNSLTAFIIWLVIGADIKRDLIGYFLSNIFLYSQQKQSKKT